MLEEILEESWAYREMVRDASLKALKQGKEQARDEQLQDERALLISYIEARFPEHLALARECAEVIARPSVLNRVIVKLFSLQETAEVGSYLQSFLQRHRS